MNTEPARMGRLAWRPRFDAGLIFARIAALSDARARGPLVAGPAQVFDVLLGTVFGLSAMPFTVLIIDDTFTCRESVATALRKSGYRVVCAENGRRAMSALDECSPDLILLDLAMPDGSAADLLKQVRALPGLGRVPVILFTGSGDVMHLAEGLGVRECLIKSECLVAQIRAAIGRALASASDAAA